MDISKTAGSLRTLTVSSLLFGVLGGGFYWWVPMGMVLSLAGLLFGIADWTVARRRTLDYRLSIVGILLSMATLALDLIIAILNLQTVTFGGQ